MADGEASSPGAESSLKEQLRAAKDNIEFLKSEHASMLKGLHEEIETLHRKCRDLQFRCEAEGCVLPDNDFFRCSPGALERKVEGLLQENADLKRRLHESHQAIDILDQKEKVALWHHHREMERRDAAIAQLERELDAKAGARRKKGANFWRRLGFSSQTPSHSQYQSCSSYSSLSDKSASDDEERRFRLPPIACPRQLVRQQLRVRGEPDALLAIDRMPSPEVKRLGKAS